MRLNSVDALSKQAIGRDEIREYLNPIYDLERLLGKVSYRSANPRDMIAFRNSLKMLPHIKTLLKDFQDELLSEIDVEIDTLDDICTLIENAIEEDPLLPLKKVELLKPDLMKPLTSSAMPKPKGKTGWQS